MTGSESTTTPPELAGNQRRMSRRHFLKVAVGAGAGTIAAVHTVDTIQNMAKFLEALEPIEEATFTVGLDDEVPPALQSTELPGKNEHFRPVQIIVREAFDTYDNWREKNPKLNKLHWRKPDNYLNYMKLASNFIQEASDR